MRDKRKPDALWRHLLIVFGLVLVFYVAGFGGAQYWRQRQGPWIVDFGTDAQNHPRLVVSHPRLEIEGVAVVFPDAKLDAPPVPRQVAFDIPSKAETIPFGTVKFIDTTFLPGTVTFDLFGHEVELLPRVLIVDKQEHPWESDQTLSLTNVPSASPAPRLD